MIRAFINLVLLSGFLAGCASGPTLRHDVAEEVIAITPMNREALKTALIEAADDVGLPPQSHMESGNPAMFFGGYGNPVMGYAAKITVTSASEVDVAIQLYTYDASVVSLKLVDFKSALARRIRGAGNVSQKITPSW